MKDAVKQNFTFFAGAEERDVVFTEVSDHFMRCDIYYG